MVAHPPEIFDIDILWPTSLAGGERLVAASLGALHVGTEKGWDKLANI